MKDPTWVREIGLPRSLAMFAPFFRRQHPGHPAMLDWALILAGALFAWLLWPASIH